MEINSVSPAICRLYSGAEMNQTGREALTAPDTHALLDAHGAQDEDSGPAMTTLRARAPETFVRVMAGNIRVSSGRKPMIN